MAQRMGDVYILLADSLANQIWKVDISNMNYSHIDIENHQYPMAIDYDPTQNTIYWTDTRRSDIRSCDFNGDHLSLVRQLNSAAVPDGMALDVISRLIFYTDTGNDIIAMMDMTGYYHKTIIKKHLDQPRGIALDRAEGLMYWTDWGTQPKIERATYLGANRITLVSTDLIEPSGLTLDTQAQKMYWCDAGTHTIERIDFDGSNRTRIERGTTFRPFSMFLFEEVLYITDWDKRGLRLVYLNGKNSSSSLTATRFQRPNGIHVLRTGAFLNDTNACTTDKGGCEHICIPTSGGKHCTCADGWVLETDGLTCTECELNVTYGTSCIKLCLNRHCASSSSSCDIQTGNCDAGKCQSGWKGDDCTQACEADVKYGSNCEKFCDQRHCAVTTSSCSPQTGTCVGGCRPGWKGDDCTLECQDGLTYGSDCGKQCSDRHCQVSSTCDKKSGSCVGGCQPGWREPDCSQACELNVTYGSSCHKLCKNRHCASPLSSCDVQTGNCDTGKCRSGWEENDCTQVCEVDVKYGSNCEKSCDQRHCAVTTSSCCAQTGTCVGGCRPGWKGDDCSLECQDGLTYGSNCGKQCSDRHCQVSSTCDKKTGSCVGGCQPGWREPDCAQACELNGNYGFNCHSLCQKRHCDASSSSCGVQRGNCDTGKCQSGWEGDDCTQACELNVTYGSNCNKLCKNRHCFSSSSSCDIKTGHCDAGKCQSGWEGNDCTHGILFLLYVHYCFLNSNLVFNMTLLIKSQSFINLHYWLVLTKYRLQYSFKLCYVTNEIYNGI